MIKLAITGCLGRMGQSITRLALQDNAFEITTILEYDGHPQINEEVNGLSITSNREAIKGCDCLIDFTTPASTLENLKVCVENKVGIIIGTTGLTEEDSKTMEEAAKVIPIVYSGNMSTGVNILFKLTQTLSATAPVNYKAAVTEAHHIHKKDAPSGTAKMIEKIIDTASEDRTRSKTDSIREGEIIGDHSITFESDQDIITISHHAKNRDIFAIGALTAAKFLASKQTGLFNMQDVLGLN
ncbi:4-hydroxy-tetrahydrodipicolinate reductase [Candidatus Omnitrophota bacterium]